MATSLEAIVPLLALVGPGGMGESMRDDTTMKVVQAADFLALRLVHGQAAITTQWPDSCCLVMTDT